MIDGRTVGRFRRESVAAGGGGETKVHANSVELSGWIELVDLPEVVVPDPAEHERIRESRLADVMIVLERDAAEIAQAIGEQLVARWPGVREAHVDLAIADDAPEFTVHVSADQDPAMAALDLGRQTAALAEVLEVQIADAIQRRIAVKRRFSPRIHLASERLQQTANLAPAAPATLATPTGTSPARETPEIAPTSPLKITNAGRFWLLALFALIALVLFGAAGLIAIQPS